MSMSWIFQPDICNIADHDVPVLCPFCGFASKRDRLSDSEKQFLIDATGYHDIATEFRFLLAMKAITDQYPGTRHVLLAGKLPEPRVGFTDEDKVSALLARQPELCDFLSRSTFRLDCRFPFVLEYVERERPSINRLLVACPQCDQQYLILPQDYYLTIG